MKIFVINLQRNILIIKIVYLILFQDKDRRENYLSHGVHEKEHEINGSSNNRNVGMRRQEI